MTTAGMVVVLILILFAVLFLGSPVKSALGFVAICAVLIFMDPKLLSQFAKIAYTQGTNTNMIVAPLFILMSEFLSRGGIAEDLFSSLSKWTRKIKGGLAVATTLACTIFAALCGSSPATAASIGKISINEMIKRNYSEAFAAGTVAGGGTLGIMIPPSITFVIYGILTETSIVKLFMAGLLPGIMLSALFCITIVIRATFNPSLVGESKQRKALPEESIKKKKAEGAMTTIQSMGIGKDISGIIPSFALIIVVLGAMYTGIATPTEAAGLGAIGAFVIIIILRRMSRSLFMSSLEATTRTGAMLIVLMICGFCLSFVVSYLGIASHIASSIADSGFSRYGVLVLVYVLWLILGCFIDPGSMIILTIPFLFPTLRSLGFDPVWIGVVSVLCVEIGMITPPVGLNLFVIKANTEVSMASLIKGSLPSMGILIVGLIILTIFPGIATFLPGNM